jgi:hypothetical protein
MAQDQLNQAGVLALRAPNRVANADWAVHEDSVAQRAFGAAEDKIWSGA